MVTFAVFNERLIVALKLLPVVFGDFFVYYLSKHAMHLRKRAKALFGSVSACFF
jgi:hypothetical protein